MGVKVILLQYRASDQMSEANANGAIYDKLKLVDCDSKV